MESNEEGGGDLDEFKQCQALFLIQWQRRIRGEGSAEVKRSGESSEEHPMIIDVTRLWNRGLRRATFWNHVRTHDGLGHEFFGFLFVSVSLLALV